LEGFKKMSIASVRQRLAGFANSHPSSKFNALKEVAQEIAIFGLSQTDFFKRAAFAGGTSLRMFWGLERFSEDLDFSVLRPNSDFVWSPYLQQVQKTLGGYGFSVKITDRSEVKINAVKVVFLKDNSVGKVLTLDNAELDKGLRPKTIKICAVDWPAQVADVERFLKDSDRPQLKLWGTDLFLGRLKILESYLPLR
jgi:hypothetical protein